MVSGKICFGIYSYAIKFYILEWFFKDFFFTFYTGDKFWHPKETWCSISSSFLSCLSETRFSVSPREVMGRPLDHWLKKWVTILNNRILQSSQTWWYILKAQKVIALKWHFFLRASTSFVSSVFESRDSLKITFVRTQE